MKNEINVRLLFEGSFNFPYKGIACLDSYNKVWMFQVFRSDTGARLRKAMFSQEMMGHKFHLEAVINDMKLQSAMLN